MEKLALAIIETAEIREKSWDGDSYHLTIHEAAKKATDDTMVAEAAWMMLSAAWNDALDWADAYK